MHQKQGKIPSMNHQTFHFANEFKRGPKTFLNQISNCKQSSLNLCFRDTPCLILRQISTSIKGPQASELRIQKFTQKSSITTLVKTIISKLAFHPNFLYFLYQITIHTS